MSKGGKERDAPEASGAHQRGTRHERDARASGGSHGSNGVNGPTSLCSTQIKSTMNLYFYLFYKFNRFLNKNRDNEWGPIGAMTFFLGLNIGMAYIMFFQITKENFDGTHKAILITILASLFFFNSILFLNRSRVNRITERYEKESRTSKRIGGCLIVLYILLSFGLVFL